MAGLQDGEPKCVAFLWGRASLWPSRHGRLLGITVSRPPPVCAAGDQAAGPGAVGQLTGGGRRGVINQRSDRGARRHARGRASLPVRGPPPVVCSEGRPWHRAPSDGRASRHNSNAGSGWCRGPSSSSEMPRAKGHTQQAQGRLRDGQRAIPAPERPVPRLSGQPAHRRKVIRASLDSPQRRTSTGGHRGDTR